MKGRTALRRAKRKTRRVLGKVKRRVTRTQLRKPPPVEPAAPAPVPTPRVPELTIVMPVYNVEDYIGACLDSVLKQSFTDFELIVVDDCSPDRSMEIVESHAASDDRIRILRLSENGGLSHARNAGASLAQGKYLCFLDSDDVVEPHGYETAVASLRKSGSDFAVLGYERFDSKRRWHAAPWITKIHETPLRGTTAAAFPAVLANAVAWSKVYRLSFWQDQDFFFPVGVKYEDQPVSARAYALAKSIDVLGGVAIRWRARDDKSSISQQIGKTHDLVDRFQAAFVSLEILEETGSPTLFDQRLCQLIANDMTFSVSAATMADEAYWAELVKGMSTLLDLAEPWMWEYVAPQYRVAYELVLRDDRERLIAFFESGAGNLKNFPTTVIDGKIHSCLPYFCDDAVAIPENRFQVVERQRGLVTAVRRVHWVDESTLEVQGWAYIDNIDVATHPTHVEVMLQNVETGHVVPLATRARLDPEVSRVSRHKWCNYEASAFSALVVHQPEFLRAGSSGSVWRLMVSVVTAGIQAEGPLKGVNRWGSAGYLTPSDPQPGVRIAPRTNGRGEVELVVEERPVTLLGATSNGRTIDLTFEAADPEAVKAVRVSHRLLRRKVEAPVTVGSDGELHAVVTLPELPVGEGRSGPVPVSDPWVVRTVPAKGRELPVAMTSRAAQQLPADAHLWLFRTQWGNLGIAEPQVVLVVQQARVVGEELEVSLRVLGAPDRPIALGMRGNGLSTSQLLPTDGIKGLHRVPLHTSVWDGPDLPLAQGTYVLTATSVDDGQPVRVEVSPDVIATMPVMVEEDRLRGRIERNNGQLTVTIEAPLLPGERGLRQQRELEDWHQSLDPVPEPSAALFRAYYGENTACNPGAVHAELRRRGSDIQVYWAVKDFSVPVPEGGIAVVHESRRWYELLRNAKYVMDNMHQPAFHAKADHQVVIETFHGYPFKLMGHSHWEKLQFTRQRVDSFDRRASEWDYLVSPASYATPLLRHHFRYEGDVLEIGYPRNDVLQDADASRRREDVRRRLGVSPTQTAILYAPTFRDYLSENDHSAPLVDFLDVPSLSSQLGEDFVVLMRGHAFNARAGSAPITGERVVDVTSYPDVADLYLAADAAVVDYSSLRFDFGVTGKPMLFMVPDLNRYIEGRGWLFDYESSAPGPLLQTTQEVVAAARDLLGVQARYAHAYAEFQSRFLDLDDGHAAERLVEAVFERP